MHPRRNATAALILPTLVLLALTASAAHAQPTLSKVFTPSTIGPGSVSTITFTITNGSGSPVTSLAFTDTLPAAITIADPANASTTCDLTDGGTLSAPDGGSTIALSDARIAAFQSCTVTVDVTASTIGMHTNPAITLSSSAGSSMSLAIDLTVATDRPGFSKSFAPSSIPLGDRSTLTFTIDNTLNASPVGNLDFTDTLPLGMLIADPANASTDCISAVLMTTTLTAVSGTDVIVLDADGDTVLPGREVLPIGATCTVTVDVVGVSVGMLDNVTGELTFVAGINTLSSGKASDTLAVSVTPIALTKSFTDDPVPPGGSVTLDFTITNFDRNFSATGVAFADDLTTLVPPLAGLTAAGELSNDCGPPVTFIGGTTIDFSGGTIAPESSCTISVGLSVPPGAVSGAHTNTTSTVTATIGGSPVVGNAASDILFVEPAPIFTKEFVDDPTTGGGTVTLRFTITNTDATSDLTGIDVTDDLNGAIPGLAANGLVAMGGLDPEPLLDPCGTGSVLTIPDLNDTLPSPPFPNFPPDPTMLIFTGGDLAMAGSPGDFCTFDVILDVPAGTPSGAYLNTTSPLTATPTGTSPTSDSLIVVAAPALTKQFTDDPVAPGGTVTLEFTLSHPPEATGDATDISFTDDLNAMGIAGLTVNLPPSPDPPCGAGSSLTAPGNVLTLQDGSLMPDESCTFSVTLDLPALAPPGNFTNTTGTVSATEQGLAVTSAAASDVLVVSGLTFTKEFLGDPVIAGGTVTLRFVIANIHPTDPATGIDFDDDLAAVLPGASDLTAVLPPATNTCGGTMSGPTFLSYTGGSLTAGTSCTIDIVVLVPAGTADGTYGNITSSLTATQGGSVTVDPVLDFLVVDSNRLQLTKAFTDDPVSPGDPVTLELILTNLDATLAASGIGFTDDLGAALAGLTFDSVLLDTCAGTVGGIGTTMVTVSGVSLAAGASCTLRLSLNVPGAAAAGVYTNTTSTVTGTISGLPVSGAAASDDLDVIQVLTFSKSFDGPATATGTATLTFTITNPGTDTASGISFSDDLDAVITGLIRTSLPALPCGAGSSITGISILTFTGGELAPMGMCSFDVDVLVPATATAGTFPNTTSDLFQSGLIVAVPATASLVIEPPPLFSKSFAPSTIVAGATSTLTFTIDNTASALAASNLDFTDNLPAGVVIANPANASTTCTLGAITAVPGTGVVSYTGGTVGAGASCTVTVDVTSAVAGAHVNTTGDLTSSSGTSGMASDTLTVTAAPVPGFSKLFAPDTIAAGATSTLTFTIDNTAALLPATGLDFTDNLPAGVVVATPANASTTCSAGTLTAVDGSGTLSYTGGTVAASSSCTVSVDVTSVVGAVYVNTTGDLTSSLGNSGTASDTLTVNAAPVPGFSKVFAPDNIVSGALSTLTFTIDNTGSLLDATAVDFTDNLPAGVVVATPSNASTTCTGGTLSAADGSGTVSYTGGTVPASSSCTLSVDVTSTTAGAHVNTTGDLTSSLGNSGTATDTLTVGGPPPPVLSVSFNPDSILPGGTSLLTITIDNSAALVPATGLDLTDNLPAGVEIASPGNASTTCTGGTLTADDATTVITYTGGTVAAGAVCVIEVDVTAPAPGTFDNTTDDLTSSSGNSGQATGTLLVFVSVLNIPTLGEWGLVLLSSLLALFGVGRLRRRSR